MSIDHYIPKSILRFFSIDNKSKSVWVYSKLDNRTFSSSINKAGGEGNYNQYKQNDEVINFENAYDLIDQNIASLIKSINKDGHLKNLSFKEKTSIADMFSVMLSRSPKYRHVVQTRVVPDVCYELQKKGADPNLVKILRDPSEDIIKATSYASLNNNKISETLKNKVLILLESEKGKSFCISDSGILSHNRKGAGLQHVDTEVFLPISKRFALGYLSKEFVRTVNENDPLKYYIEQGFPYTYKDATAYINALSFSLCHKYIFSHEKNFKQMQSDIKKMKNRNQTK